MKQVTSKQFMIAVFLIMMAQKMFLLSALLVKSGGRSSYISMFLMQLIEIFLLVLILLMIKLVPNRTFYNLLDKGATRIGGRVIALLMLFVMAIKMSLHVSGIRVFINISLSQMIPNWIAIIPVLIFLILTASKSLRTIGRMSEIFAPFVLIAMVILFLLVIKNVEPDWMLPLLEDGIKPVGKNMSVFTMWYGDISYFLIFLGQVKREHKRFILFTIIAAVVAMLLVQFFSTVLIMSYADIPYLLNYGNNVTNMLLYSSFSFAYGRFDIMIFSVWIFSLYIQIALIFYFFTRNIKYVTGLKGNYIPSFIGTAVIFLLVIVIFHNEHEFHLFRTQPIVRIFSAFNHFIVPIFVFIVAIVLYYKNKKRKQMPVLRPNYIAKIKKRKIGQNGY